MKTLILIFVLLITTCLYSTIINVPGDQPTIQAGINVAVDADTVLVQPDTYYENINYNGKLITVGSLFLTSHDTTYISSTIIDGNSYGRVVRFNNSEDSTAVLCGFTITNGLAYSGGGISCIDSSNPTLTNVTITGNTADENGGGIACYNSNPNLVNVTITGNSATYCGGIYCGYNSNPTLTNVTITGNTASTAGGGIYCNNSNPNLVNVTITGNSATYGGGIYCGYNSNPTLTNVTITGNSATYGGGISCIDSSNPTLTNVTITGNTADENGGGIYCNNSNPSFDPINRCNIFLNFAGSGCDLYAYNSPTIDVIVDTFTVLQPDDYFAYPIDNFTFDILNAKVEQVDQDLYVSPDGSNNNSGLTVNDPLLTISYALVKILADSTNTLTIHLSNGTYSPSGTGEIFQLNCRSFVSLLGEDEISTILDGEGLSGILFCQNDNNFSIENMTIQNGSSHKGGGICCWSSSPSLVNVTITGNSASGNDDAYGGGIYCANSSPNLQNVTITGNTADNGGGICCEYNSNPVLTNVTISNNFTYGSGGGIRCSNSSLSLVNVTITGNSASDSGGGIYCYNSSPSLNNVTISGNSAMGNGGGFHCWFGGSPSLVNVTITGNSAYAGGGILCWDSNPNLQNVTIIGNTADNGGGFFCGGNSNPNLVNVTITGNSADYGGGIFCSYNASPSLLNCILWNDSPQEIYFVPDNEPSTITISYSDINGGEAGIVTNNNGTVYWLEGNINEDPLFVGTGYYPFSLLEDSPCIDAGNPDPIYYDPEDPGNPGYALYPAMGTVINDMGAYGGPNAIGWPVVGLDDNVIVQTPEVFLQQNYPNPFNPNTSIEFSIQNYSKVNLSIYNIKGQKVKQLVCDQLSTGQHSAIWNGRNSNDKRVGSGIYFYKLKVGNYQKVKKMVLLK